MRLVFAGTPEAALPSLQAFADSGHELVGVVTRPDAQAGRGRRLTPSPLARQADALESAAAVFADAVRERAETDRNAMVRVVALATALARTLGPVAGDPEGLGDLARELLAGLDAPAARLVAPAATIDALRPLLPELAARAGFEGRL